MQDKDGGFTRQPDLNFSRGELTEFLDYWRSKCRERNFPTRADINPREIERLLPWVNMYDVSPEGEEHRIRLLGSVLSSNFNIGDLRGKPLSSFPPLLASRARKGIDWVLETRGPIRAVATSSSIPGQEFQGTEICAVPLSDNGQDINIVMVIALLETHKIR
ncbi:MAG: PAS domain-containing protein [Pseudomonadota bacterium]